MRRSDAASQTAGRRIRAVLGAVLWLGLCGSVAGAQSLPAVDEVEGPPAWAYALAGELMSPFCPGRTLTECPSPQAESLRMWIILQAAAGRSRDDVQAELYERYGDQIRATPRTDGIGGAAYVIPVVAFLAGGALLAAFLRRATRRTQASAAPTSPSLDPEAERKLDEVLSR